VLSYPCDVSILEGNTDTIKKSTFALLNVSKEFDIEANPEKTKYMLMSRNQKLGLNLT
jgi:hypothetical protein